MKAEIKLVKLGENMNGEGLIVCNEEVKNFGEPASELWIQRLT